MVALCHSIQPQKVFLVGFFLEVCIFPFAGQPRMGSDTARLNGEAPSKSKNGKYFSPFLPIIEALQERVE